MRTFYDQASDIRFGYSSDMSGEVIISGVESVSVCIPGSALLAFMAEYIRQTRITEIENMTTEELLGKVK